MDPGWVIAAIALSTTLIALLAWVGRWAWRILRRTSELIDDWNGRKPAHGHPGYPGLMERLGSVEDVTNKILSEVTLDSGKSVKDVVNQTQGAVTDLQARVDSVARQVENLSGGAS
jgi:hypothetical protein